MTEITIAVTVFEFVVLIFSAVLHEVAHGLEADRLGDDTARRAGRLTLNPLKHMDFFGSFLMPLFLLWTTNGSFFFAYAKPVPYDPRNLKDPRVGSAKIALAGPVTNFILAAVFGIAVRAFSYFPVSNLFLELLALVAYLNIMLGVFNCIPIPPLDGSRVLFAVLPQTRTTFHVAAFLERYGMFVILAFVFFGFQLILPLINFIFTLFAGQPFSM
jgi:Zn-dependent protease